MRRTSRLTALLTAVAFVLLLPSAAFAYAPDGDDFITCVPEEPSPGSIVTCTGGVFDPGTTVVVTVDTDPTDDDDPDGDEIFTDTVIVNDDGTVTFTFEVPADVSEGDELDVTLKGIFEGEVKVLAEQLEVEEFDEEFIDCEPEVTIPGGTVDCEAGYYDPGTEVDVFVEASVLLDTTVIAQADGTIEFSFTVPEDHETGVDYVVTTTGQQNGEELELVFVGRIEADEDGDGLPDTGSDAGTILAAAGGAVVLGGLLLLVGRRSRDSESTAVA